MQQEMGKTLRVLMVVEATLAGVGRHVLDLREGLAAQGHEVHLIYSPLRKDAFFSRRLETGPDAPATSLPMRREIGPWDLAAARAVRDYLQEHGPFDILHGHSSKGGALARLAGRKRPEAVVYTPHAILTMNPRLGRLARAGLGSVERLLGRWTNAVIAVSPEEQEHLQSLGFPPARIRRIPNCVPVPELPTREQARRQLHLPTDARIVGFVGRLAPQKAPDVLIRAFGQLALSREDVHLAIIGTGEMEPALRDLAEQTGRGDRIHWLGAQAGQQAMAAFDLFALPSR
ncbi:MAG: glycosyltransferase, partial [Planctomycetota bacterium]